MILFCSLATLVSTYTLLVQLPSPPESLQKSAQKPHRSKYARKNTLQKNSEKIPKNSQNSEILPNKIDMQAVLKLIKRNSFWSSKKERKKKLSGASQASHQSFAGMFFLEKKHFVMSHQKENYVAASSIVLVFNWWGRV